MEQIQSEPSQPDRTLEKGGAASVEDLESSEKQKNKEIQKRSSSTPEINISQDDALRQNKVTSDLPLREKKLKENQKSIKPNLQNESGTPIPQDKEVFSEDETSNANVIQKILSEVLAHVPSGGSDYQTSADSIVRDILADMLMHTPVGEIKSAELIAHNIISEVLSHLSSEVAAHKVSLDCEYLKEHLGAPLALALCEVVIKRPVDPIHYLAHWLFKWRWNQQQKQIREEEINALNLERKKKIAELKEKERLEAEQRAILEVKKQASEAAVNTLETALSRAFDLISQEGEGETAMETGEGSIENTQP